MWLIDIQIYIYSATHFIFLGEFLKKNRRDFLEENMGQFCD